MRTKKEILKERPVGLNIDGSENTTTEDLILEALIDIRDVLANLPVKNSGSGGVNMDRLFIKCPQCKTPLDNTGNCCNGACGPNGTPVTGHNGALNNLTHSS